MVQILPEAPSFGQQFARNLSAGVSRGVDQASQFAQQMALQKQKDEAKNKRFGEIFAQGEGKSSGSPMELSPEQETVLALQDPTAFNAYKHLKESRQKEQESLNQKENLKETLHSMSETLLGGKLGYTPGRFLTKKGRRDAQYFDTLNTQLESIGKELVSKGVLSAPRFAFLLANLPASDKTDASNAGAIEAWHKELNIPLSEDMQERLKSLYEENSAKKQVKKQNKVSDIEKKSTGGTIRMKSADGKLYAIPIDQVEEATEQGLVAE